MSILSIIDYVFSLVIGLLTICIYLIKKEKKEKHNLLLFLGILIAIIMFVIQPTLKIFGKSNEPFPPTVEIIQGVPLEKHLILSKQFDITESAVKSFFKIMEQKKVPIEDLDATFRKIAVRYKELQNELSSSMFDDQEVLRLKKKAKNALDIGDFDLTEKLLNESSTKSIACVKRFEETASKCRISAAESKEQNGDLAITQLDYKKAIAYYKEAVEILSKESELILARYLQKLGTASLSAGDYICAEKSLTKSLSIRENKLPLNQTDIAKAMNNLAALYYSQGKYEEAEPLYIRALKIAETVLGSDHPDVGTTLNNLAALYKSQSKYEEAEPLYIRALKIAETVFGSDHSTVGTALNNLAWLYYSQGKYEEALPLFTQAREILETVLGPGHPKTKIVQKNYESLPIVRSK